MLSMKINFLLVFIVFLLATSLGYGQIAQRGAATTSTSTNSNTITINKPVGVVAGDIMIANINSTDGNNLSGTNANLTGWTLIDASNLSSNRRRGTILYRLADGTEGANFAFTVSNGSGTTDFNVGAIIAFSGVDRVTPFDVGPGTLNTNGGSTTVTATGITTTSTNTQIIMLGMADLGAVTFGNASWNTTSPGSLTELYDVSNTSPSIGAAMLTKATAGNTGNGTVTISSSQGNSGILLALRQGPVITGLSASPACPGSSITITGTNLTGATNVTIGGTPVTSITSNTATQIIAVIGNGTTGTVQVITPRGSATSAGLFTVYSAPANPSNPTSNSPQCNPGGVTITQSGSAPIGETWYWQTTATGTSTANNASTPWVVNTSNTYYVRSRNNVTGCWSIGAGSVTVVVNNTINTTASAPIPTDVATNVCYTGSGAISSLNWTAAAGATGYDVYFGTAAVPPLVSTNQAGTTYNTGTLLASTTYYWRIVPRNSCGATTGSPTTWSFTTNSKPCYCTPSSTLNSSYIDSVSSTGTLADNSNVSGGYSASGYGNFTAINIATQIPGGGINLNLNLVGPGQAIRTYIDWNNDGVFADPAELYYSSGTTTLAGPTTFGIVVPSGQTPGNYRMRIRTRQNSTIDPCTVLGSGEAEDYTISVVADCAQKITSYTNGSACGSPNTVNLSAVSAGANGFRWYSAETGGSLLATTATGNWTTPSIATTTTYWVTAYNGTCESLYRTPVKATILTTTNITITPSSPIICGENAPISINAAGDTTEEDLLVQDFESGLGTWGVSHTTWTNSGADSDWSIKTSPYQPTTTSVWKPAINSGAIATTGNKFALTTSDYNGSNIVTILTSPIVNPSAYTSLTLTFDHFYSNFSADSAEIQVSINGGAFAAITPTAALYTTDIGTAADFVTQTVNLNSYALPTNTQLQFRFVYTAQFDDGWAIDNIRLYGVKPLNTTFTWSGGVDAYTNAACTIPYTNQSLATIYVLPNASQISSPSWSFTATATLSNGCSVVKNINVTNNTKTWSGASSQLWNDPTNWTPNGVPNATHCVVIPSTTRITGSGYNAYGLNLTIKPTGNLEIQSNNNLTITDIIDVKTGGVFNVRNSANLVQVNNVSNTGSINMERTAFIDYRDYVYWSSPVANFNSANISTFSNNTNLYKWIPTVAGNGVGNFGNWTNGTEIMVLGKGYIERGLNNAPLNSPVNFTSTFTGVPNNGNITTPISRGTYNTVGTYPSPYSPTNANQDDDNWNLLGNPYPSSLDAKAFLTANAANLDGFVKIWRHGIAPSSSAADPFYNNYAYNYDPTDYLTYNLSGAQTQSGFDGYIGAGQGFITKMLPTSAASSANAIFNNTMRSSAFRNDQFYKNTNSIPEGRVWIDLVSSTASSSILVAYVNGATNQKDQLYDAQADLKSTFSFYSLLEGYDRNIIQGRSVPFDQNDLVPLAIKIPAVGNYTIAIQGIDGFFSDTTQNIYLEDKLLNVIHNLRSAPYQFSISTAGEILDRFVLRYTNQTLSNSTFDYNNTVGIYADTNSINVKSSIEHIKQITVYDILGKTLISKTKVGKNEISINELKPTTSVLIIKTVLDNGTEVTKKVIF